MRKFSFVLAFLLILTIPAFAGGLGDAYKTVKNEVSETFATKPDKKCSVHADTPWSEVNRNKWEIEIRMDALDFPSGGPPSFRTENLNFVVIHNLSNQLYAYGLYGNRAATKTNYEGSAYEPEWDNRMVMGGFGFYVFPNIKIFAGAGKIWAVNENGDEPQLETAIERGIALDIPLMDYKIEFSYRFVEAQISDDNIPVSELTGDGTFSALSIGLVIPLFD
jgi:hypothetical protein